MAPVETVPTEAAAAWRRAVTRAPVASVLVDLEAASRRFGAGWRAVKALEHVLDPVRGSRGSYVLERVDAPGQPTLGALRSPPDRPDTLSAHLLADDDHLPGLSAALDPGRLRDRLSEALGRPVAGVVATPVRYWPHDRCVVRYDATTPGGTVTVYGKVLATGGPGLHRLLAGLGRAVGADGKGHDGEGGSALPRVPAPLAWWDDLQLVLQPEVRGDDLGRWALTAPPEAVRTGLPAAGRSLATFHARVSVAAPERAPEDDLTALRDLVAAVGLLGLDVADRYAALGARLHGVERTVRAAGLVTTHGAMRPSHVRYDERAAETGGAIGLIDLDGCCRAEPERDLGELLAYLRWRSAKRPAAGEQVVQASRLLLDGYRSVHPVDATRLRQRSALSLTRLVGRRFAALDVRRWPAAEGLLDEVDRLLDA